MQATIISERKITYRLAFNIEPTRLAQLLGRLACRAGCIYIGRCRVAEESWCEAVVLDHDRRVLATSGRSSVDIADVGGIFYDARGSEG